MVEVLSLVNFDNQARVQYLERSFRSFYKYNNVTKHIVVDGSHKIGRQKEIYDELGITYFHQRTYFSERLKFGLQQIKNDYFVFLPDDYEWIHSLNIEDATTISRKNNIKELKFVCPPMQWFSMANPSVEKWYDKTFTLKDIYVPTHKKKFFKSFFWSCHRFFTKGERLLKDGDLYISRRHFRRSFMQQFSLGCHLIEKHFLDVVTYRMPNNIVSAGDVEKFIYKKLLLRNYLTAYYKMLTPAFHFIDLNVEGEDQAYMASTNLLEKNKEIFRRNFG